MTKPRPWPNNAREARDRAAEETQAATQTLESLMSYLNDHVNLNQHEVNVVALKASRALVMCQRALRHLESVGAPTRPQ